MSIVHDLRTTLLYVLFGVLLLSDALLERAAGEPVQEWLVNAVIGGLFCLFVADGVQRRWRGDPRTHEAGHDARTLASSAVGFLVLLSIGLWSRWQGHELRTWGVLVAGGLLGAALLAQSWYTLEE